MSVNRLLPPVNSRIPCAPSTLPARVHVPRARGAETANVMDSFKHRLFMIHLPLPLPVPHIRSVIGYSGTQVMTQVCRSVDRETFEERGSLCYM
eukprot:676490-Prymnesium_polylepis.2